MGPEASSASGFFSRYGDSLCGMVVLICAATILLQMSGDAAPEFEMVDVSGTVTLDGDRLKNVHIRFEPLSKGRDAVDLGPASYGLTGPDGRFRLRWSDGEGAVPGEHRIILECKDLVRRAPPAAENTGDRYVQLAANVLHKLPAEARDGSIRFTVPIEGTQQAHFNFLSSPAPSKIAAGKK